VSIVEDVRLVIAERIDDFRSNVQSSLDNQKLQSPLGNPKSSTIANRSIRDLQ